MAAAAAAAAPFRATLPSRKPKVQPEEKQASAAAGPPSSRKRKSEAEVELVIAERKTRTRAPNWSALIRPEWEQRSIYFEETLPELDTIVPVLDECLGEKSPEWTHADVWLRLVGMSYGTFYDHEINIFLAILMKYSPDLMKEQIYGAALHYAKQRGMIPHIEVSKRTFADLMKRRFLDALYERRAEKRRKARRRTRPKVKR